MDNIKKDFRERGWSGMELIHLVLNREQWRTSVCRSFGYLAVQCDIWSVITFETISFCLQ
jgi:hypothetical protein